jgi:putative transposase
MSAPDRRAMLDRADKSLSVRRQCALLGVARSGVYRAGKPANDNDAALMRRLDELFTAWPFLGSRRMTAMQRAEGVNVNRKRVQRLMRLRLMGIAALRPKPRTTKPSPGHKIYPYLLRNLTIERANSVWAADITYIPIGRGGFLYLVAIIDWASRAGLAWRLSNTMDVSFCLAALEEALAKFGRPEIFNTDQGSQFTSAAFTGALTEAGVAISIDGRGRWMDNVFIERLGGLSNTRTSISRATPTAGRLRAASPSGSPFITNGVLIRRWATAHRWRSGARRSPPPGLWT